MARILLVDDDPDFAATVHTLLSAADHQVDTAPNLGEASALLDHVAGR